MPRRTSSRSTEGRGQSVSPPAERHRSGSPYDYPASNSRNTNPNSHAGSAYPFPDQAAYATQPPQGNVYTNANGVTYLQHTQAPTYHHAPTPTYPAPSGTPPSYPHTPSPPYAMASSMSRTRSREPSPPNFYGVPQVVTYDDIQRPREPSPARGRPPARRGEPYESVPPTPGAHPPPPMRRNSSEQRMAESAPGAPRLPNVQSITNTPAAAPPALARVDSYQLHRRSMRRDSTGSWNGEQTVRSSVALVSLPLPPVVPGMNLTAGRWQEDLEEGNAKAYAYAPAGHAYNTLADAQYAAAQGYRLRSGSVDFDDRVGFPGSPGSDVSSSGSDFSTPATPPPLHVDTGARTVRWNKDLHLPSPVHVHRERRKGFFNARGDQLWTNAGAYKPPNPGEEYPEDLRELFRREE